MSNRTGVILIVGAVTLILAAASVALTSFLALGVLIVAGAVAGYLVASRGLFASKGDAGKAGASTGALVGVFGLVGLLIGTVILMATNQDYIMQQMLQTVPPGSGVDESMFQASAWVGALGANGCCGLIGIGLAALGGLGGGYLGGKPGQVPPPNYPPASM